MEVGICSWFAMADTVAKGACFPFVSVDSWPLLAEEDTWLLLVVEDT
jgi:hypothetical protein